MAHLRRFEQIKPPYYVLPRGMTSGNGPSGTIGDLLAPAYPSLICLHPIISTLPIFPVHDQLLTSLKCVVDLNAPLVSSGTPSQ